MIEEMGLGEVIQALSLNRHRGTLRIESDEGISKFFYLSDGEIVLIRTVKSEPVRIGELLVRAGKIDHEQLEAALTLQKETKQRLGDALIALGHVTSQDVDQVVRAKFEEEFLDVFLLDRGHFEFIFGLSPESLFSPDEKLERIALNTSSLMLEAMRRVDDWQSMRRELGSLDEVYRNRLADVTTPIEEYVLENVMLAPALRREVYEALDGKKTIRETLAAAQNQGASRLHVFQFIHALKQNDLIRPLEAPTCLAMAKEALDKGDSSEAAKFIRAVMAKERIEIGLIRRYIEFLRKAERPQLARRECKTLAAQYLTEGDVDGAITLYQVALELDQHDTEVLDRLFYTYLRKSDVKAALDVGYKFRGYMQRENDLAVVARVVKNLRELEPEDSRVLEISGLLLKRQERVEEARRELDKALAAVKRENGPIERQQDIVKALLELDPKQAALAREKDKLERDALIAAERQAARKRIRVILALGGTIVAALLAVGEIEARSEIAKGDGLRAQATDLQTQQAARDLYLKAAHRISTVGGQAERKAQDIDDEILAQLKILSDQNKLEKNKAARERDEAEKKARAEREQKEIDAAMAAIDAARARKDWKEATRLALALVDARKGDPRVATVTVPTPVASTPPGATARIEGYAGDVPTPGILLVPARQKVKVVVARPGYSPIELDSDGTGGALEAALQRGPAWRIELESAVVGPLVAARDRALVVTRDGRIAAVGSASGKRLWERPPGPPESGDALLEPATPAIVQGVAVVGGRSGLLLGLDVATGQERWRFKGEPVVHPPVSAEVAGVERAVICHGSKLAVIDALEGKLDREIQLPAAPAVAPVARSGRAAAVLMDGTVVLVDLAQAKVLWTRDVKVDPCGPPVIATELGTVLAASREGLVLALKLEDGSQVWKREIPDKLDGGLSHDETRIYVATVRAKLWALDTSDGRPLWEQTQPGPVAGPPVRLSTSIFLALKTGELAELFPGDGRRRGAYPVEGTPTASPAIVGDKLLLGAERVVFAFERAED
jgi:outer membrane protein assembly factor BamB/Flp pilus assembly protein TadD